MRSVLAASVAGLLLGAPARANDSAAELAAGGIVLETTSDIEMCSEDLSISPERVRVATLTVDKAPRKIS
jgi:Domain of unknown function (DUF4424)